jgi:hypothetical protein
MEKVINNRANQSPSGENYFTELAFLSLGDILYEIAAKSEKCGDIRSLDSEGKNIESNAENHKPSALAILLKAAVRK